MFLGRLAAFLDRISTARGLILLLVLSLACQLSFSTLRKLSDSDARPLDRHFHYSAEQAYEIIARHTPDERRAYVLRTLTLDVGYPVAYSLLLAVVLTLLLRRLLRPESGWQALRFLPFVVGVTDLLENTSAVLLVLRFPNRLLTVAGIAGWLTTAKWSLVALCGAMIAAGLLMLLWQRLRLQNAG